MPVNLTKDSIDLGIVIRDPERSLGFYRDTLGLALVGEIPMPVGGGAMYQLQCGTTVIKLVEPAAAPPAANPPGGIAGGYGIRYLTISVDNLTEVTNECTAAGHTLVMPPREIRDGVSISIVEDPDGNWVEFLQRTV